MLYFLDTNTLIDILDGNEKVGANFLRFYGEHEIRIPNIAYYEVLRGFEHKDPKNQKSRFENFCVHFRIEQMDLDTLRIAARLWATLRKNGEKIDDDDDILIGALSVQRNATLVTSNTKHFARFDGIRLENWRN